MFKEIHSIEINEKLYNRLCSKLLNDYNNINLYLGDSGELLGDIVNNINEGITFYLDGYFSGGITGKSNKYDSPIINELKMIHENIKVPNKTLIIIDDINMFSYDRIKEGYCEKENLIKILKNINNNFNITFENNMCIAYI
jgi:hypothetical protein